MVVYFLSSGNFVAFLSLAMLLVLGLLQTCHGRAVPAVCCHDTDSALGTAIDSDIVPYSSCLCPVYLWPQLQILSINLGNEASK